MELMEGFQVREVLLPSPFGIGANFRLLTTISEGLRYFETGFCDHGYENY